jgi:hypothetical protein
MSEKRKKRKKPRVTTSLTWIQRGPLAPWMYKYLQWLAQQPEAVLSRKLEPGQRAPLGRPRPYTQERTAAASKFACRGITQRMIRELEQRKDAVEYFEKLRADVQFQAREAMKQDVMEGIEARREALQHARAREQPMRAPDGTVVVHPDTGKPVMETLPPDGKLIDTMTRWIPELAFPKKVDSAEQAPRVVIHLNSGDAKALLLGHTTPLLPSGEPATDVDYEVIPNAPDEQTEEVD